MNTTFQITVYMQGSSKPYTMNVEFLGEADGYIQFKVYAKERFLIMERPKDQNRWKVIAKNFDFKGPSTKDNYMLWSVTNQIDLWINDKTGAFRVKR